MRLLQKKKGIRRPEFHRDEMMHLLAFLAAPGAADPSGDPAHGARVFQEHRCVQCHSFQGLGGKVGPELSPIAKGVPGAAYWAQRMWNHVDLMTKETLEQGVPWPLFRNNELADLIAFLQKGAKKKP
jgi:cytochrome c2